MEISEDHPNENKQRLFIQSIQGGQPSSLVFGRDSKAGWRAEKLRSLQKERLQVCSD